MTDPSLAACAAPAGLIQGVDTMRVAGAAAAVTGKGVSTGSWLVRVCARVVVEGGPGAEGVCRTVHTACGAERVGVTAGTASGTALLKGQPSSTAAKDIAGHFNAQEQGTAAGRRCHTPQQMCVCLFVQIPQLVPRNSKQTYIRVLEQTSACLCKASIQDIAPKRTPAPKELLNTA